MAFDGIFLRAVINEITGKAKDRKVEKIHQTSENELVFSFRGAGENLKLLISASPSYPRIGFIHSPSENPAVPPMFCMLLRKKLCGAVLRDVSQQGFDRCIILTFEGYDDFGEKCNLHLACEFMGRCSNIILLNDEKIIIDSIKRVDISMSEIRQILPGVKYTFPPSQNKMSLVSFDEKTLLEEIESNAQKQLAKIILSMFEGVSPIIAREIVHLCCGNCDVVCEKLSQSETEKLVFILKKIGTIIQNGDFTPYIFYDSKTERPIEFSYIDVHQYGVGIKSVRQDGFGTLLENYYKEKATAERVSAKSKDILRVILNAIERISKKTDIQKNELIEAENSEILRQKGEIINANLYRISPKDSLLIAENFYDGSTVEIKLDPRYSGALNAQKYFKDYRKKKSAALILKDQIKFGIKELNYLDSVFDGLSKCENEKDIEEIRTELIENGYIKRKDGGKKRNQISSFMEFSYEGYTFTVGKNNLQNDRLTLKTAEKNDIWFHAKDYPGSHVVLSAFGKSMEEIPDDVILFGAEIAAFYSKAEGSCEIDYTYIKHIKKPPSSKPGTVIYHTYFSLKSDPSENRVLHYRVK